MSTNDSDDLWPADLPASSVTESPLTMLKVQAQALGKRTQNLVYGQVYEIRVSGSHDLCWGFALRAPALGDYSFKLFDVQYDPSQLYPLILESEVELRRAQKKIKLESPEQLKEALKEVFSAPRTRKAIDSILAQSK